MAVDAWTRQPVDFALITIYRAHRAPRFRGGRVVEGVELVAFESGGYRLCLQRPASGNSYPSGRDTTPLTTTLGRPNR